MAMVMEGAVYRGFDTEAYYCPMKPDRKIEHLLIPGLSLAMISENGYHSLDPENCNGDIVKIDLAEFSDTCCFEIEAEIVSDSRNRMEQLLKQAVHCLEAAKREHDRLEAFYIPNMDFAAVDTLRLIVEEQIRNG